MVTNPRSSLILLFLLLLHSCPFHQQHTSIAFHMHAAALTLYLSCQDIRCGRNQQMNKLSLYLFLYTHKLSLRYTATIPYMLYSICNQLLILLELSSIPLLSLWSKLHHFSPRIGIHSIFPLLQTGHFA